MNKINIYSKGKFTPNENVFIKDNAEIERIHHQPLL